MCPSLWWYSLCADELREKWGATGKLKPKVWFYHTTFSSARWVLDSASSSQKGIFTWDVSPHGRTYALTRTQFTFPGRVFVVLYDSCQAKISYFTQQTLWHQDISRSQVSVNIILLLYVRHALCYLQQQHKEKYVMCILTLYSVPKFIYIQLNSCVWITGGVTDVIDWLRH